jgi:hypothetical protein
MLTEHTRGVGLVARRAAVPILKARRVQGELGRIALPKGAEDVVGQQMVELVVNS